MAHQIKGCSCSHPFQDNRYGQGQRVHTVGGTTDNPTYTCAVCGNEKGKERATPKKETTN